MDNQRLLKLSYNVIYFKDLLKITVKLLSAFHCFPASASATTIAYIIQVGNLGMIFSTFSVLGNFAP